MSSLLFVSIGGFFGAISRYFLSRQFHQFSEGLKFPFSTWIANISGSFLLGILLGFGIDGNLYALIGVGFLGSLTTFSTLFVEFITLLQERKNHIFYLYFFATYIFGMFAAFVGFLLGHVPN